MGRLESDFVVEATLVLGKWLVLIGLEGEADKVFVSGLLLEVVSALEFETEAVLVGAVALEVGATLLTFAVLADGAEAGWLSPMDLAGVELGGDRWEGVFPPGDEELATNVGNCQSCIGAKCCWVGEVEPVSACARAGV